MGAYYTAHIAWGLYIPEMDLNSTRRLYLNTPDGFSMVAGGDTQNGMNVGHVLSPHAAVMNMVHANDALPNEYGVYPLEELYQPTQQDIDTLREFARDNDIDYDVSWFAVTTFGKRTTHTRESKVNEYS